MYCGCVSSSIYMSRLYSYKEMDLRPSLRQDVSWSKLLTRESVETRENIINKAQMLLTKRTIFTIPTLQHLAADINDLIRGFQREKST